MKTVCFKDNLYALPYVDIHRFLLLIHRQSEARWKHIFFRRKCVADQFLHPLRLHEMLDILKVQNVFVSQNRRN